MPLICSCWGVGIRLVRLGLTPPNRIFYERMVRLESIINELNHEYIFVYWGVAKPFNDTSVMSYCKVALGGMRRRGIP